MKVCIYCDEPLPEKYQKGSDMYGCADCSNTCEVELIENEPPTFGSEDAYKGDMWPTSKDSVRNKQ